MRFCVIYSEHPQETCTLPLTSHSLKMAEGFNLKVVVVGVRLLVVEVVLLVVAWEKAWEEAVEAASSL